MAEEYSWAITQAEGWSCCGRSGDSVLESGFQLDSKSVCVCIQDIEQLNICLVIMCMKF